MRYNKMFYVGLLIIVSFVPLRSYGSLTDFKDWLRRIRVSSTVQLGQYRIPFLSRKVRLDCSLELCTKPMTVADLANIVAERIHKIGDDLGVAVAVIKLLCWGLWQYIKENPIDSAIIGGGALTLAFVITIILQRLLTPQPPQERCRGHAAYSLDDIAYMNEWL